MKRDTLLLSVIALLVVVNLFSLGMLWKTHGTGVPSKPGREAVKITRGSRFLYKELDFSEQQRAKIGTLQRRHFVEMRELERSHMRLRRAYLDVALSPDYNPARGDSLIERMARINAQMQEKTWFLFRTVYEECTPGQKNKYRKLMLDLNRRHHKRGVPPVPFRKEGIQNY